MRIKSFLFILLLALPSITRAQIRLPALVSDGMVLQRDTPVRIWGWAAPGEEVRVTFTGHSFATTAASDGEWEVTVPPQPSGGPFQMHLSASNRVTLENILFGDVWLCSGQSNMQYPFNRLTDTYAEEIARSRNSNIRQFLVPQQYDFSEPLKDYPSGSWVEAAPESLPNFSAVAYFFAKSLHETYDVPIGIINASIGGSPAESWMSREALAAFPEYLAEAEKYSDEPFVRKQRNNEQRAIRAWYRNLDKADPGLQLEPNWKDPQLDHSGWKKMLVPGYWEDQGDEDQDGSVWFRKTVEIPAERTGTEAWIQLGRIVDADSVFINGQFVGTTAYQYPQRKYSIPGGVLRPGKNVIVIRVINNSGKGGFVPDKPYRILTEYGQMDLRGEWHYKVGCRMPPTPRQTFVQWKPTGLYNGMIAPSNPYMIKGVAWYQGESNESRPGEYRELLTALIHDWRAKRGQGAFPFLIAQIPNYLEAREAPVESNWAELRHAQLMVHKSVKNTGLSVNIDLGEWNDIHPQNKKDVGERLALTAKWLAYGDRSVVPAGPIVESAQIEGKRVILSFKNKGGGLVAKGRKRLQHFLVAGKDGRYVRAKARIKGDHVIVQSRKVKHPAAVRYAWADNPEGANLYNREGLPASPFTTGPQLTGPLLTEPQLQSDNGDGTYTNPVIYADFPDPDVIRVDSVYYFVSTTMFIFPGVTILKSYDLVNWEYCSNAVPRMDFSKCYDLDGCDRYGHGQWATSMKYHEGTYYLLFITLDEGGFVCTAEDPAGPWKIRKLPRGFYDPGLFFDDDGRIYVAHGYNDIYITELNPDLEAIDEDVLVFSGDIRRGLEGAHVYKIDGYYYLYCTYGGFDGFQVALRSRDIYGPYEQKIVIRDNGNLGSGIHQGALVETPGGEWWSVIFQDGGAFGRFPTLQPVSWIDGWPMVGVDGKGVVTYRKPDVGRTYPVTTLPTSDEFSDTTLGMQWGWNHNPADEKWSLSERPGHLRLHTVSNAEVLPMARNTLTQRIFAYYSKSVTSNAVTRLDIRHMKNGDIAGLAVFQDPYGYIGIRKSGDQHHVIMVNNGQVVDSTILAGAGSGHHAANAHHSATIGPDSILYLQAKADYATSKAAFFYSTDNQKFKPLGNQLNMQFNLSVFTGNKFCLFNYATWETGGYVDFDWFRAGPGDD